MNLRQKVKRAKKELIDVEDNYRETSAWAIAQKFQAKSRLQKIIDYKRKPSRYYYWHEEHKIDWSKLTYISLHADYTKLLTLHSVNGKPITKGKLGLFTAECRMKIYEFGLRVQQRESDNKKHTDYVFVVSNDRTKGKRLHSKKIYCQYDGDDMLYPYDTDN